MRAAARIRAVRPPPGGRTRRRRRRAPRHHCHDDRPPSDAAHPRTRFTDGVAERRRACVRRRSATPRTSGCAFTAAHCTRTDSDGASACRDGAQRRNDLPRRLRQAGEGGGDVLGRALRRSAGGKRKRAGARIARQPAPPAARSRTGTRAAFRPPPHVRRLHPSSLSASHSTSAARSARTRHAAGLPMTGVSGAARVRAAPRARAPRQGVRGDERARARKASFSRCGSVRRSAGVAAVCARRRTCRAPTRLDRRRHGVRHGDDGRRRRRLVRRAERRPRGFVGARRSMTDYGDRFRTTGGGRQWVSASW